MRPLTQRAWCKKVILRKREDVWVIFVWVNCLGGGVWCLVVSNNTWVSIWLVTTSRRVSISLVGYQGKFDFIFSFSLYLIYWFLVFYKYWYICIICNIMNTLFWPWPWQSKLTILSSIWFLDFHDLSSWHTANTTGPYLRYFVSLLFWFIDPRPSMVLTIFHCFVWAAAVYWHGFFPGFAASRVVKLANPAPLWGLCKFRLIDN